MPDWSVVLMHEEHLACSRQGANGIGSVTNSRASPPMSQRRFAERSFAAPHDSSDKKGLEVQSIQIAKDVEQLPHNHTHAKYRKRPLRVHKPNEVWVSGFHQGRACIGSRQLHVSKIDTALIFFLAILLFFN
jgi:hypothetical protein